MCKMIISPGVFSFSQNFGFLVRHWCKTAKKWSKMAKDSVPHTLYLRNHTSYELHLWYTGKKGYL